MIEVIGKVNDYYFPLVTMLTVAVFLLCRSWAYDNMKPEVKQLPWYKRINTDGNEGGNFTSRGVFWLKMAQYSICAGFFLFLLGLVL